MAVITGAVASFNTFMPAKLNSVVVDITPVQSGSGDPSPSNVRPISGWTGTNVTRCGKNLFDKANPIVLNAYLSTTKIESSSLSRCVCFPVKAGVTYTISKVLSERFAVGTLSQDAEPQVGDSLDSYNAVHTSTSTTITTITAKWVVLWIYATNVDTLSFNDILDSLQIEVGSSATAYTPYTGTSIPVQFPALGKNLFDNAFYATAAAYPNSGSYGYMYSDYIQLKPNTTYTMKANASGNLTKLDNYCIARTGLSKYVVNNKAYGSKVSITTLSDGLVRFGAHITASSGATLAEALSEAFTAFQIQLEEGSTATSYEPYTNTVYGGTVDVTTGVLTVTWKGKTFDGTTNIRLWQACNGGNWFVYDLPIGELAKTGIIVSTQVKSSHFRLIAVTSATTSSPLGVASAEKYWLGFTNEAQTKEGAQAWLAEQYTNGTPVQFAYVLDTPLTYQLTPQQITALKGINNIWHDANGNTTVKYWKH